MLKRVTAPYKSTVLTGSEGAAATGAVGVYSRRPLLMAGLGAATISCSAVFVAESGASPVSTAFYRTALALPVLIVLAVIEQRRHGHRPLAQRVPVGVPSALGDNVLRVRYVAFPIAVLLVAMRQWRPRILAVSSLALALSWNVTPLAGSIAATAGDPSTNAAFWAPAIRGFERFDVK